MYFASTRMKQAAAIFLLGIFSFNIFGYRLVADYLSHKADTNLEIVLDNEAYQDEQLLTIKQPINLPYYTNSKNFQRAEGEVRKNGIIYKYVKCRIYNDSLEMLCIPHTAKMQIQNSREAFFKLTNDLQQDNNKKTSHPDQKQVKNSISEFEEIQNTRFSVPAIAALSHFYYSLIILPQTLLHSAEQPPDAVFTLFEC